MQDLGELKSTYRRPFRPRRLGLGGLMAAGLAMVVLSFYGAQASVFETARAHFLDMFRPVLTVLGAPARWIGEHTGGIEEYFDVKEENARLREENAELRVWMQEAMTLRRQLAYYETILETKLPEPARFVDASVIGEDGGPFVKSLLLSAGTADGIDVGNAVVDGQGLLGHIVAVGERAGRVLVLTDYASRVPVFVEGLEVEALLAGRGDGRPVLEFFSQNLDAPVSPGVRLITSGAGGTIPRGIPVGEVLDQKGEEIRVRLFANHRTPDLVRVIDYAFPDDLTPVSEQASPAVLAGEDQNG